MRILLSLFILLAAPILQAEGLDTYQATVKVDDQGAAARDKALREALASVLAHASGLPNLSSGGRTAPLLARASALISSVSYQTNEENQLELTAIFDPNAVDTALRQQGLPVHGVTGANFDEVRLSISGIVSTQDYARALAALRSQPAVKNLSVVSADGDTLRVNLRAEGGAARLAGALSVGNVLRRDAAVADAMSFTLKR